MATALECGEAFRAAPSGGGLTLTGRFPTVASSNDQVVSGTVQLATDTEVRGVVGPAADVFLVRAGRIVTLPLPQDSMGMLLELSRGMVVTMPATATLTPCDSGAAPDGSLPPGAYDLYARVVLNHDDGTTVESVGGPWPLEVR